MPIRSAALFLVREKPAIFRFFYCKSLKKKTRKALLTERDSASTSTFREHKLSRGKSFFLLFIFYDYLVIFLNRLSKISRFRLSKSQGEILCANAPIKKNEVYFSSFYLPFCLSHFCSFVLSFFHSSPFLICALLQRFYPFIGCGCAGLCSHTFVYNRATPVLP